MEAAARRAWRSMSPSRDADRRRQARSAPARTARLRNRRRVKCRRLQLCPRHSCDQTKAVAVSKLAPPGSSLHRLLHQLCFGFRQDCIACFAVDLLATDLQHDGNRERRDMVECFMNDSPPDTREHLAESADIEKPGSGIGTRGTQKQVIGLVFA